MQAHFAADYSRLYHNHWWGRSREAILVDRIARLGLPPDAEILDVGCGDGLFFGQLQRFGRVRGIEVDETLLDPDGPYRHRISTEPLGDPAYNGDAGRFDLVAALDVIEHIADDAGAVRAMTAMLRPGGTLLVTVPAFPILWDQHDEINAHHRRYTARTLRHLLAAPGLDLVELRYLYRGLFPPKLLVAWWNRGRSAKIAQHTIPAPAVNRWLTRWFVAEDRLLRRLPIPFGTSLLAVARRAEGGGSG